MARDRAWAKANGLCVTHHTRKAVTDRTYCEECLDKARVINAQKRRQVPIGKCPGHPNSDSAPGHRQCVRCLEYHRVTGPKRRLLEKLEVLNAYGGVKCACSACPYPEPGVEFLSIDHIENDGAKHRKTFRGPIYRWLKKNGFPSGFQVLCLNCNVAKGANGGKCPHLFK